MVKIMENPIKLDDLGGFPPIFGNTPGFTSSPRGSRDSRRFGMDVGNLVWANLLGGENGSDRN